MTIDNTINAFKAFLSENDTLKFKDSFVWINGKRIWYYTTISLDNPYDCLVEQKSGYEEVFRHFLEAIK